MKYIRELTFKEFELILLPDEEVSLLEEFRDLPIISCPTGPINPAAKRDCGAEKAKGELFAFIDDDAYPQSDWLEVALNSLENLRGVSAIGGPAITPNNDGLNDIWTPLDIQSYQNALVQVFNRWGGLVFESKGGENYQAWDGTDNGKELVVGTYYYIIDLNTGDEPQTGPITIIR